MRPGVRNTVNQFCHNASTNPMADVRLWHLGLSYCSSYCVLLVVLRDKIFAGLTRRPTPGTAGADQAFIIVCRNIFADENEKTAHMIALPCWSGD
jgi:hypothetical protein